MQGGQALPLSALLAPLQRCAFRVGYTKFSLPLRIFRILDYRQDVNLVEKVTTFPAQQHISILVVQASTRGDQTPHRSLQAVGMTGKHSYTEAYKLVKAGRITVDGTPATTGQIVNRRQVPVP